MRSAWWWCVPMLVAVPAACGAFEGVDDATGGAGDAAAPDAAAPDAAAADGGRIQEPHDGGDAAAAPRSVRCDGVLCKGEQVCCITLDGGAVSSAVCEDPGTCATTFFACDDGADCAEGEICCAKTNGRSYDWHASSCQKRTTCVDPDVQLCNAPSECAAVQCVPNPTDVSPVGLSTCTTAP